jgi:hypothetical protein
LPDDVPTLPEGFTPEFLLSYVATLLERRRTPRLPGAGLRVATVPGAPVVA